MSRVEAGFVFVLRTFIHSLHRGQLRDSGLKVTVIMVGRMLLNFKLFLKLAMTLPSTFTR
jgi:hypothetical protein